ncbi:hypothetical protein L9F63_020250, partial [Diploptera punctata]
SLYVTQSTFLEREKFEGRHCNFYCGFYEQNRINSARFPCDFFLIAVIFLIFDVEIALLLPITIIIISSSIKSVQIWILYIVFLGANGS